jgi:hypothetical protein
VTRCRRAKSLVVAIAFALTLTPSSLAFAATADQGDAVQFAQPVHLRAGGDPEGGCVAHRCDGHGDGISILDAAVMWAANGNAAPPNRRTASSV